MNCKTEGSIKGSHVSYNTNGTHVGGIVGYTAYCDVIIKNCNNQANIEGDCIGGMAGYIYGYSETYTIDIENCYNIGEFSGSGNQYTGGLVGQIYSDYGNVKIKSCYNTGSGISGGIVGILYNYHGNVQIESSYNEGKCNRAGIVGYMYSSDAVATIENSYNKGAIEGSNSDGVGGIIGYIYGYKPLVANNCYNEADIKSSSGYTGGLFGKCYCGLITSSCYNKGDIIYTNGYVSGLVGWNEQKSSQNTIISNCYNLGNISPEDLETNSANEVSGIISEAYSPTIISDCYNKGNIIYVGKGYWSYVGGIMATDNGNAANIYGCYNEGNIDIFGAASDIGGISSGRAVEISGCYNLGNINIRGSSSSAYIGGIQGYGTGETQVKYCYNKGNIISGGISTWAYVGGISGYYQNVMSSYNTGDIITNDGYYVGGIGGYDCSSSCCYNTGNITNTGTKCAYVGGIIGYNCREINNSYNTGNIANLVSFSRSESVYAGGITGYNSNKINNCYNIGNVKCNASYNEKTSYGVRIGAISGYNYGSVVNSYYLDNIEVIGMKFINDSSEEIKISEEADKNGIPKSSEEMKSMEFFNTLNVDDVWSYRGYTYPKLTALPIAADSAVEVTVENKRKELTIITMVNSIDGIKGGSISGELDSVYEVVEYGNSNTKEISMVPDSGYGISSVTVNDEEIECIPSEDGSFSLPIGYFDNMNESKTIVVTYTMLDQILKINKYDSENPEKKLEGAKFKIEQLEERETDPEIISSRIGDIVNNGQICDKMIPDVMTIKTNDSFDSMHNSGDQLYMSTNKNNNSSSHLCFEINLEGLEGNYRVGLEAEISSESYDYGYAIVDTSPDKPSTSATNFMRISGKTSRTKYKSSVLTGGSKYYLHLMYVKDGSKYSGTDRVYIYNPQIYEDGVTTNYYFEENEDGQYVSNNKGIPGSEANSYIPIDLTNTFGKYNLVVNAEISSTSGDYGNIRITNEIPTSGTTYNVVASSLYGEQGAKDYKIILSAGEIYYLNFIYTKNGYDNEGSDAFKINSINLTLNTDEYVTAEAVTDSRGNITQAAKMGKFKITELEAPEGYQLDSTPIIYDMVAGEENVVNVPNTLLSNVLVHYYEEGTGPENNCEAVQVNPDIELKGSIGEEYTSEAKTEINEYKLITDTEGKYILPTNASGTYKEETIDVYYYYKAPTYSYNIHYFYNGIENEELMETIQANIGETIERTSLEEKINTNKLDGYYVFDVENIPLTISESENDINIYYERNSYNYIVNYYYDGNIDNEKTASFMAVYGDKITTYEDKNITGYKKEKAMALDENGEEIDLPLTIKADESKNVINVYYVRDRFDYTIKYYYDGQLDENKTETKSAVFGGIIDTYQDKNITGYVLEKTENKPLTITEIPENNVISVYYVKGEFGYAIEYYYDGIKEDDKTITGTATYGDVIDTYKDKNITGYVFEKTENKPLTITEIPENNIMKVYYVKDKFGYTIEYYYDGIKEDDKTVTGIAAYGDVIDTYEDKSIAGYVVEKTENKPLIITEIPENNVMKVYYVKASFGYSVHYYYDGTEDVSKKVEGTATYGEQIKTYTDKNIAGYKFEKTEGLPLTITEASENNVIKVYYVKDSFGYSVHYYYDGTENVSEKVEGTALYGSQITTYTNKNITGYKLEKTEGLPLTITEIPENNVIKVYYVKDSFGYSIHYYYDGKEDVSKKVEETATYEEQITTYTDKNIDGYKLSEAKVADKDGNESDLPLIITSNPEDNRINVYYVKDSFGYEIHYFYDGEEDTEKTESVLNIIFGSEINEIDLQEKIKNNKIHGYKYVETKIQNADGIEGDLPLTITSNSANNKINVHYVKDSFGYEIHYFYDNVEDKDLAETDLTSVFESKISKDDIQEKINSNKKDGYKFVSAKVVDKDGKISQLPLTITTEVADNQIRVDYVTTGSFVVTEKHIEITKDGKENELYKDEKVGEIGKDITINRRKIDKYEAADRLENSPNEIPESIFIMTKEENRKVVPYEEGGEYEVWYYYSKKKSKVTVEYVDNLTEQKIVKPNLPNPEIVTGTLDEPYKVERKDIPGYKLDETRLPQNEEGKFTEEGDTIKYYYIELKQYELQVIYTANGEEIDEAKIMVKDGENIIKDEYTNNGVLSAENIEITDLVDKTYTIYETETPEYCKTILSKENPGIVKIISRINENQKKYEFVVECNDIEGLRAVVDDANRKIIVYIETEKEEKYDLAIKKFISSIDRVEISDRAPVVTVTDDGKITYKGNDRLEKAVNNQLITYTIRTYNESETNAKGKRIIEYVPDGLVFVPQNETNKKFGWKMYKADEKGDLVSTDNIEEAEVVISDYVEGKAIPAFDKANKNVSYLDVQAVFKVDETKITSQDRIVENKVQIVPNKNDPNPDNDITTEKVYVKYFDLAIEKYIETIKINTEGKEEIREIGYDKKGKLVKIDVKNSEVNKTKLTVTYGLIIKNVGQIPGYATAIKDYIPKDFKLVSTENWKEEGNVAINTSLGDVLLEPGESTTAYITFEWQLSEANIGEKYNEAEIAEYKNDFDAVDVTDDNKDKEGLLVTLKTGSEVIAYVGLTIAFIGIIATGVYLVKRYTKELK